MPRLSPLSATTPVAVAQGPHIGLCFHPEMTDDPRLHQLFLERAAAALEVERGVIIRSASFRDLARIEQLYREATEDERHGAQMTPDSPVPQATLLRLWQALTKSLSSLVPITDVVGGDARRRGRQGRRGRLRAGPVAVRCVRGRGRSSTSAPRRPRTATSRVRSCSTACATAVSSMACSACTCACRLTIRCSRSSSSTASRSSPPSRSSIATRRRPSPNRRCSPHSSVPRDGTTSAAIYLLYLRTTPSQVAAVEGPSLKTWQGGVRAGARRRRSVATTSAICVVERPGIVAWAAIRPPTAAQPASLSMMCRGARPGAARRHHRRGARASCRQGRPPACSATTTPS